MHRIKMVAIYDIDEANKGWKIHEETRHSIKNHGGKLVEHRTNVQTTLS